MRIFWIIVMSAHLQGQGMPPCGVTRVAPVNSHKDQTKGTRFFPYPQELVKKRVIQALLAAGAEVRKDNGDRILAGHELWRLDAAQSLKGRTSPGGMGKFEVQISSSTQEGQPGTSIAVEFRKNTLNGRAGKAGWAAPVLDETACLLKTLAVVDPLKEPQGPSSQEVSRPVEVQLPKGSEVKVRLSDVLYSKETKPGQPIAFQVAEDVTIDGKTMIRRGALATGKITGFKERKGYGRGTELEFSLDTVVASDGQKIAIESETVTKGNSKSQVAQIAVFGPVGLLAGAFVKGSHAMIRAGTEYSAQTVTDQVIVYGKRQ